MPKSLIFNVGFWNILEFLQSHESPLQIRHILEEVSVEEDVLLDCIDFLNEHFNLDIYVSSWDGIPCLLFPKSLPTPQLKLNFSEWLSLICLTEQGHDISAAPITKKVHQLKAQKKIPSVSSTLKDVEAKKVYYQQDSQKSRTDTLERARLEKKVVSLSLFKKDSALEVYIHRLLYIDSKMHLIGEDCSDKCLIYLPVESISKVIPGENSYAPFYSKLEVAEFINSILSLSDLSARLVLKIKDLNNFDERMASHLHGRSYITTNSEGETIWAATVEANDELFEWLYQIKSQVEILDPSYLIEEFESYCHQVAQEVTKKAS